MAEAFFRRWAYSSSGILILFAIVFPFGVIAIVVGNDYAAAL
jgi:hypothetical protein